MRSNLTSLERLEAQIRALQEGTPQGAAWEAALVRWVNAGGHPDLVKGWGWKQWPGRAKAGLPRIERGVDLIAEDRAGRLVAIQAKFRNDPDSPVKTGEVQKFVGAYRKHFPRRMLISNASSRARGIKEAVGDGEAELVLRTDLAESLFDWVASKPLPRPKVTPLPFQKEAAAAIKKHLQDGGRAQIVMACGSGKTYTTLLAMEALGSKRVLVLAPTLLLVKQLRDEWMRERTHPWATLAVCSDIGTDEGDDSTHVSPGEIGSKPTTDPAEIAIFLKSKGPYVVFGTYASSARIATAQKKAGVPAFDLVVADEAHRIAGAVGKADKDERAQRVVLDEKSIRAERRLFATATPRVYGGDKKKDGEEVVLESMDDPTRFGEEVYKLTFQQAVDLKRLVPYKLLVTIVTNEEIAALIHDRKYVDVQGKQITADDLATAIAVRRAYKELGISRVISYHGNIKRARAFAQLVQEIKAPGKAPEAECVTGAMPVEDRKEALTRLANAEGPYLITNARCLTEGIDVPALDAVAFADPRRSQVDIVQAVGRAMRKPRGTSSKTTGYIILPVFLSKNDLKDPESAVEGSAFAPVLQVLRALKAHDPYRATFFAKILVEEGKRPHKKGEGIDEILQVSIGKEMDRALAKRLEQAVQLRAVEVAANAVDRWLIILKQFVTREGHARVPSAWKEDGASLGNWAVSVRQNKYALTPEQQQTLHKLGFSWNPREELFDQNLELLATFIRREGHSLVPAKWKEGKVRLGSWVNRLRTQRSELDIRETEALERVGFVWDHHDHIFQSKFDLLQLYVRREGNALVPKDFKENGVRLGQWVSFLRLNRSSLSPEQVRALNSLGMIWDAKAYTWEQGRLHLAIFFKREGHARVPQGHVENGFGLGSWVTRQRQVRHNLTQKELTALTKLAFDWNPKDRHRAESLAALKAYFAKHGHCEVPSDYRDGDVNLGQWTGWARANKKRLTQLEISSLTKMGFRWDAKADLSWERHFTALNQFIKREGHAKVPYAHVESGDPIGVWLTNTRRRWSVLTPTQEKRLRKVGISPDRTERGSWDVAMPLLERFVKREGHARVPQNWIEEEFKLGTWIAKIRSRKSSCSAERIVQLNSLGMLWKVPKSKRYQRVGVKSRKTS